MKSIFENDSHAELLARMEKLTASTPAEWGKMKVDQMLSHCSVPLEGATGKREMKKEGNFLIRLLFKRSLYNDTPYRKNLPTAKSFLDPPSAGFDTEKQRLLALINTVHTKGATHTWPEHPAFGAFTGEQWGKSFYKHLDHHLRQFGV